MTFPHDNVLIRYNIREYTMSEQPQKSNRVRVYDFSCDPGRPNRPYEDVEFVIYPGVHSIMEEETGKIFSSSISGSVESGLEMGPDRERLKWAFDEARENNPFLEKETFRHAFQQYMKLLIKHKKEKVEEQLGNIIDSMDIISPHGY